MLNRRTVQHALKWLLDAELLLASPEPGALRLAPGVPRLIEVWVAATGQTVTNEECEAATAQWTGSTLQRRACHDALGTTVHNLLVAALDEDLFAARLLSQILWYFGDCDKRVRAKFNIDGKLWWASSPGSSGRRLGVSADTAKRGLIRLVRLGLLQTCIAPCGPHNVPTTHIRPNFEQLRKLLAETKRKLHELTAPIQEDAHDPTPADAEATAEIHAA